MNIIKTKLDGVLIIEPRVFEDPRGFFMETYHAQRYRESGVGVTFCAGQPLLFVRGDVKRASLPAAPRPGEIGAGAQGGGVRCGRRYQEGIADVRTVGRGDAFCREPEAAVYS